MKLSKVHHIAIICSDYPRSLDFYTKTLGLRVIAEHYRAARDSYKTDLALGDDYVVELFSFPNPPDRTTNPEATGLRHLAFATDDLDSAASSQTGSHLIATPNCHSSGSLGSAVQRRK